MVAIRALDGVRDDDAGKAVALSKHIVKPRSGNTGHREVAFLLM